MITIEGSCSLTGAGLAADGSDFRDIPYMAFGGFYAGVSQQCRNTVAAVQAAGGRAAAIALNDPAYGDRFKGVTHMMMLGTGHPEVFDEILRWTRANIRNPSKKRIACGKDDEDD